MLEFSNKHFKAAMLKMPPRSNVNTLETSEKKTQKALARKVSENQKTIKKNQIEILELKNTITK